MSALAKRRPDYRNVTAQAVKARVHDELRANVRLVQQAQAAREELFWNAVIADFERDAMELHP